ncbi:MAG: transposase [Candidatus Aenigmatarchaeota archaeon]
MGFLFFEKVPDYAEINRRIRKLNLDVLRKINKEVTRAKTKGRIIDITLDGTGVQINGKYVWIDKKAKKIRKRDWKKVNIAIDVETRQILGIKVLEKNENEGCHKNTVDLLVDTFDNIDETAEIRRLYGDGGYDNENNFRMLEFLGIEPVIRVRRTSRIKANYMSKSLKTKKKRKFFENKRNKVALEQFDWEKYIGNSRYGKRSGIEGIIGSFKRFFRGKYIFKIK